VLVAYGQQDTTGTQNGIVKQNTVKADDPSQFFTRIEVFNELQHYNKFNQDFYVNQAVLRTVVKIGKRFTTRVDVPFINNTFTSAADYQQSGLGDISFRLLGYKFREKPKSAFTASIEVSMNTAASPLLGTGKNLFIPVVSYTRVIPEKKMLFSMVFQQANSFSGDAARADISFSKLQCILLKTLTRRTWMVLAPEWFFDYVHGGVSMNLRGRMTHAPIPRMNIWVTPSTGVFGDFIGRYQWSVDIGARYFLLKEMNFKKKKV
jgi:hypothetical protein